VVTSIAIPYNPLILLEGNSTLGEDPLENAGSAAPPVQWVPLRCSNGLPMANGGTNTGRTLQTWHWFGI